MRRREFLGLVGAAIIATPKISFAQTTARKALRVVVVANRYHEADGLMAAVCNEMARNPNLSIPYNMAWPRSFPPNPEDRKKPRCLIDIRKDPSDKVPAATMEIWCIDDLADTKGNSRAKVTAMSLITNYTSPPSAPDGVVAFGTAGYPGLSSNDGCATIGSTIFIHDAANDAPGAHGNWSWSGHMGKLVPSKTPTSFFSSVSADKKVLETISRDMIAPQVHPAGVLQLLIAADAVGVSSVNIPSHAPYCTIDTDAIVQATEHGATNITSVETTHGVIRSKWPDAPFIYVSAIPNRVCHFPDEVLNSDHHDNYAQEFPSSHNAGIALANVMSYFVSAIVQ